jgi:hypothetical protein
MNAPDSMVGGYFLSGKADGMYLKMKNLRIRRAKLAEAGK